MTPGEIHAIRKAAGFTQEQLAEFLGLKGNPENGRRTIARWEDGSVEISGPAAKCLRYLEKFGPI